LNFKLILKFAIGFLLIGVEVPLFLFGIQGHDMIISLGIAVILVGIGIIIYELFRKGFDEINKINEESKVD